MVVVVVAAAAAAAEAPRVFELELGQRANQEVLLLLELSVVLFCCDRCECACGVKEGRKKSVD